MIRKLALILMPVFSLALLAVGGWLIHPSVGLIVPGALLWLDLTLASRETKHK